MKYYSDKTILITGATGLIGSHIVDKLMQKSNAKIIALGRNEKKLKEGFKEYLNNKRFSIIANDITNPLSIKEKIDIIFHAAGPMEGKIISNFPLSVINPNIIGTTNCLEFLKKQKENENISGRLVLFSSVTVYGNSSNENKTVTEDDTKETTDALDSSKACYSESKRMSEVIAQAYRKQSGIDIVIARFSTVYGYTRFIPDTAFYEFIKKSLSNDDITINSPVFTKRDNIYIDDAVNGILLIAKKGVNGEAYNISSNGDLDNFASIKDIAEKIAKITNSLNLNAKPIKVITKNDAKLLPGLKLDNNKLKQLNWNTKTSLEEGIRKTIQEIKEKELFKVQN